MPKVWLNSETMRCEKKWSIFRSFLKDGKGKGAKAKAQDEYDGSFCAVCARIKLPELVVPWQNHNSKNCRNIGKIVKQLEAEDGDGQVNPAQYREENQRKSPQSFHAGQNSFSSSVLNLYNDFLPPGPRQYQSDTYTAYYTPSMNQQRWELPRQSRSDSREMMGQLRSGGDFPL